VPVSPVTFNHLKVFRKNRCENLVTELSTNGHTSKLLFSLGGTVQKNADIIRAVIGIRIRDYIFRVVDNRTFLNDIVANLSLLECYLM